MPQLIMWSACCFIAWCAWHRFKDEGFLFIGVGKSDPNFQPKKLSARCAWHVAEAGRTVHNLKL